MTDSISEPLRFARTIVDASGALQDELDPVSLLAAAASVRASAPGLCARLEAKALRAFRVRAILRQAREGALRAA
ncbi:MAG TPA: hypothetical protein VEA41_18595 [Salinarimonas sp.]|jgi:hypothetical protein|nr:hypothetical protein [Salinarimonas sp.]